ncbi:sensor domain-containing diguanylate cyclase [Desulfohalobium retbaense]|uniref:Diguanylate cyclase with PAS/PAC and GAF sensors n=1 Tax=Desulfohalobium retbaense (strain ATCC 49708 / DSM 5692 / JCM 16813 / HR100) TaxID=485915 RepID=C8X2Z9_DESRD|nr:diguanylate cyclase [Desulfohalobium retbaense]ACV68796.1 diguanylate cyclase with PAS/PAC and GAF sensors [Desulfohalobium retbaense DSM 5692]
MKAGNPVQQGRALDTLRSALARVSVGAMITDAQLEPTGPCIVYVNPAWERLTGFSAEAVVGSTPHILYGRETSANALDDLRASLKEDGTAQSETVIYRRDGTRLNMAVSISPLCLCGDGVDHYLALQWDVTAHRETCARNRDLEALTRLQRAVIMENLNIDSLRQRVANGALEVTGAHAAVVEEAEEGEMVYRAVAGMAEGQLGLRLPIDQSASGLAYRSKEPVLVRDVDRDDRIQLKAKAREIGFLSGIMVPLAQAGRIFGVLKVYANQADHFHERDQYFLEVASGVLAANLHKAAEYASSEQRRTLLLDALPAMISYVDSDLRYQEVNAAYERFYGLGTERILGRKIEDILDPEIFSNFRPYWDAVLRGETVSYEREIVTPAGERRIFQGDYHPHQDHQGEVFGFYAIVRDVTDRHQAQTDYLTGLPNRRRLERDGFLQLTQAHRYDKDLSFMMIDLDDFKSFNDQFGHLYGDEALKAVAELLRSASRDADIPARWGGEEFALLLPETDLDGAREVAERLRARVATLDFGMGRFVTASLGVAQARAEDDLSALQDRADQALYRAKMAGRNQVAAEIKAG